MNVKPNSNKRAIKPTPVPHYTPVHFPLPCVGISSVKPEASDLIDQSEASIQLT